MSFQQTGYGQGGYHSPNNVDPFAAAAARRADMTQNDALQRENARLRQLLAGQGQGPQTVVRQTTSSSQGQIQGLVHVVDQRTGFVYAIPVTSRPNVVAHSFGVPIDLRRRY